MILSDVTEVLAGAGGPLARTSPEGLSATWDGDRIRVAYIAADPTAGLHYRQAAAFGRAARRAARPRLARRPGTRRPAGQGPGDRPVTGNTPAGPAGKERR